MTTAYTQNGVHTYIVRYGDETYGTAERLVIGWWLAGKITGSELLELRYAMCDHREAKCKGR